MKIPREIVFRLIFQLAMVLALGFNAYANYNYQSLPFEHSAQANNDINSVAGDIDISVNDQINQSNETDIAKESSGQMQFSTTCFLIREYIFFVWQPPLNF